MSDPLDQFLLPVRKHLLRNLLRFFVIIAGLALAIAVIDQLLEGEFLLAAAYFLFYFLFVYLALNQRLSFELRRMMPVLLMVFVLSIEYLFFGTTALSFTMIYALVVFTGLMYGVRAALVTLALAFSVVTFRYWADYFIVNNGSVASADMFDTFMDWISPTIGQMALIAITVAAISVMFRQLQISLAEKHNLIEDLQREIQHRELAQDALKLSEEQFNRLFQQSHDAVFFVRRPTGEILLANAAAEELTGLKHDQIRKQNLASMLPDSQRPALTTLLQQTATPSPINLMLLNADHSLRDTEVTATAVESDMSFLIFRDITDKRKLEAQVAQSHKMEAIGQLAGGIAHDFNNSLQVIIGFCELARIKLQDQQGALELEKIYESGKRAQKLVSQLLAFSRRQHLETRPLDMNKAVEDSLHLVKRIIGEHILLDFQPAEQTAMILGDRAQIEQVLLNLCINARDAIRENGTISIKLESVTLDEDSCEKKAWETPGDYIRLAVSDTGSGMDAATVEKIFEPFFTTKEAGKGTGLGLSSVLGIVQQHRGMVDVESEPGKGTQVSVYLPIDNSTPQTEAPEVNTPRSAGQGTILLTEDNEMVRAVTRELLKQGGYKVIEAASAQKAIQLFEQHHREICLVILDVIMPHMQGTQLSSRLRQIKANIPVLFITGHSKEDLSDSTDAAPRCEFIQKPFQQSELLASVERLLTGDA